MKMTEEFRGINPIFSAHKSIFFTLYAIDLN